MTWTGLVIVVHYAIVFYVLGRVMLRPHREPASRVAWMLLILGLPVLGLLFYFLLGETNIGFKRAERMRQIQKSTFQSATSVNQLHEAFAVHIPEAYQPIFRIGQSINGFVPVAGNQVELLESSEAMIDALVADIDLASEHVHLLFYIWLTDVSGLKVVDALIRAAGRGVVCRILVDDLGSRRLISSVHWRRMASAQVQVAYALSIGNPFMRLIFGRIDIRNHRKIMVIDDRITYCGSQNCADAAFTVKAKYAPWVDTMLRLTGPIALQNQRLFASDWQAATQKCIPLAEPIGSLEEVSSCPAQAMGTGPTERYSAMSDMFLTLIVCARQSLIITTPYFVPNESIANALCLAARSGVDVTLNLPQKNDSWVVSAASRSYYQRLIAAGVKIFEYVGGLLHAKLLSVDGEVALFGSANMDQRSFDLNYENNIVVYDTDLARAIIQRQQSHIASSVRVDLDEVSAWSKPKLLWYNTVATFGPVL